MGDRRMIRVSTLIWVLLVTLSGYAMFQVKTEVGHLDKQLAAANRQIGDDREQIRSLNIEWATLTQPSRLDLLSQNVLQLQPIRTQFLGSLDLAPLRDEGAVPGGSGEGKSAQLAEVSDKARP
jgi:hypothetical protein